MTDTENLKLLTKSFFKQHPIKEHSAARFIYSLILAPDKLYELVPLFFQQAAETGLSLPDVGTSVEQVRQTESTADLLRMFRQAQTPDVRQALINALLQREAEVLPEIQRMTLKTFMDGIVESCVRFMAKCETNCSEWVLQHFEEIRAPYTRSMLCIVLGFRADPSVIPFLMQQLEYFEKHFPNNSYEQAPLIALCEIQARFQED